MGGMTFWGYESLGGWDSLVFLGCKNWRPFVHVRGVCGIVCWEV